MFQKKADAYYFDTIVVPAKEETFRTMALEGGYWDCIPFDSDKHDWTDTIAFYRKQSAAITHIARIVSIDPAKKSGKWIVRFVELRAIDPIRYRARITKRIRGPRLSDRQFARWLHTQGDAKTIRVNGRQVRGILHRALLPEEVPTPPALLPEPSSHLEASTRIHSKVGRMATQKAVAKKATVRFASSVWAWFLAASMDSTAMAIDSLFPAKHTFCT